jgi:hypothetical protein
VTDLLQPRKGDTVIFSRGRGSGGRHKAEDSRRPPRRPANRPDPDDLDIVVEDETGEGAGEPDDARRDTGPYDITEAPSGVERLDLGSLQIPSVDGVEIRVQPNPDGSLQQVVLVHGDSSVQLAVFAAPRSEGIWDEVRAEMRKAMFAEGVASEEIAGEYGTELRGRLRSPDGLVDVRFIGVDGPRWMVRAVYNGKAAIDPAEAGPLDICLSGLVVDRGREAMPVREALPLRLPREVMEQAEAQAGEGTDAAAGGDATGGRTNGQRPRTGGKPSPRRRR